MPDIYGPDGKIINRATLLKNFGVDEKAYQYKTFDFLPNQDDIVETKTLDIYDTMMREVEIAQSVNSIRYAVISDYEVTPASTDAEDVEVAEFVLWVLENLICGSVKQAQFDILSGIYRGYSITEKIFDTCKKGRWSGKWYLSKLNPKYAGDYEIKTDEYLNITDLINTALGSCDKVPINKFIIYTHNPKDGRPHGQSVLRPAYKHYWSKDFLLKWWNIYLQTFGMPTRVAKYPANGYVQTASGSESSQNRLQAILKDIMNNTAVTVPDDILIDFIEVSAGGGLAFQKAIEYHDREIEKAIQLQTLTSGTDGKGSWALGEVHADTKKTYVEYIRDALEDVVFNEQIIRQLVDLNYVVDDYPKFRFAPGRRYIEGMTSQDIMNLKNIGIITDDDTDTIRKKIGLPPRSIAAATDAGDDTGDDAGDVENPEPANAPGAPAQDDDYKQHKCKHTKSEYARRVNFAQMKNDLNDADEKMITTLSPIIEKMKNKMIANLPARVFPDGKLSMPGLLSLKLIGIGDVEIAAREIYRDVTDKQLQVAYGEVDDGLMKKTTMADAVNIEAFAAESMNIGLNRVPIEEIAMVKGWYESGDWKKMLAWRARKALELNSVTDAQAFWVSHVVQTDILREVKNQIFLGIQNGADVPTTMKAVGGVFEKYIERGDLTNKALADAPSLEKIVRTNTTRVFNNARSQAFKEGAASGYFPALEYSAVMDDRVSDICEELNGQVYAADDPIWGSITPPNHYNCRSVVIAVYKDDVPEQYSPQPDLTNIEPEFGGQGKK